MMNLLYATHVYKYQQKVREIKTLFILTGECHVRMYLQTIARATCSFIFGVNSIPTDHVLPRVGLTNSTRIDAT